MNGALGFHDFGCVVRPHVNRTLSLVLRLGTPKKNRRCSGKALFLAVCLLCGSFQGGHGARTS